MRYEQPATPPEGSTHFTVFYGEVIFYKVVTYDHFNEVMEKWQKRRAIYYWEPRPQKWIDVGEGFSGRMMKPIHKYPPEPLV